MIEAPTGRLHKFLAVGGMALLIAGITIPLERLNDAKFRLIEAAEKAEEASYEYSNLAIIDSLDPTNERPDRTTRDALVKFEKQVDLMAHYQFMRNVWFSIGAFCIVAGILSSYYGFSRWLRGRFADRSNSGVGSP
ncbi:MAG TPA: hypothetical protein VGD21_12640 [Lysobacter sp.]